MLVVLDNDVQDASQYLSAVPDWFEMWEQHLSRFRPDSELSRLNQHNTAAPQQVSETLWEVIQAALEAARASDGIVTPVVLNALEAAGYTTSFDVFTALEMGETGETGETGDQHPSSIPGPTTGPTTLSNRWNALETDPHTHTISMPTGMRLDLGGIAKGWAAEQAMQRLRHHGPVLVDAGGDVAMSGTMADGKRWPIAIANPFAPDVQLDLLMLRGGGVATSGRDYRRWHAHGSSQHHIIDPRTGQPANTDIVSATVVAPTTCVAEMAAKMVLILGSQAGLAWLETQPDMAGLLVCEDETVHRSKRLKHYTW
jgi:thiamine biosynthesis lipoprotein